MADLAAIRDSSTAETVVNGPATISGTGAPAGQVGGSAIQSGRATSGGIDSTTSGLSRNIGTRGLSDRSTEKVKVAAGSVAAKAEKNPGGRDREEVEEVFDQNKGAIYSRYNRALRENPTLQGKVVLRLTIQPDGSVSDCQVISSELKDPDLEAKLIALVKTFRFKSKDIAAVTTTKPIDFFPSN
jgi:TonB family protein